MSALRAVVSGAGAKIFSAHHRGLCAIGAQVVAVQDSSAPRAEQAGEALGCPAYTDLDAMLAGSAGAAHLAVVLAPHPHHAAIAIACLRAGLHVLVEKPIAVQVAEADEMLAEAERAGRLLAVAFQRRGSPEVQAALKLVRGGALGRLQRADVLATWPRRTSYFRTAPWRGTWLGEGGGILVNQGQHDLDLLCLLAGPASRVVAWTGASLHGTETEDSALAMVGWRDGATGMVRLSTAEQDEPRRIELTGTAGRLRLRPGALEAWLNETDFARHAAAPGDPYEGPRSRGVPVELGAEGGDHEALYRNLAAALEGREPLLAPGREAVAALELANAALYSGATGREVVLPLDRAEYAAFLDRRRREGALWERSQIDT